MTITTKQRLDDALNQMDTSVSTTDLLGAAYKVTFSSAAYYTTKGVESYAKYMLQDMQDDALLAPLKELIEWNEDREEMLQSITSLVEKAYPTEKHEAAIAALMSKWEKGRPCPELPELPELPAPSEKDSTES